MADTDKLVEQLSNLSVLEIAGLVKQLEEKWGVSAAAPVAKILKTFARDFKLAALKIGFVDRVVLSTAELETLAELPAREILQAQLLGLLLSPATRLVRLLNVPAAALARLLNAKAKKEGAPAA